MSNKARGFKIKIGPQGLEIEGDHKKVTEEFKRLQKEGLGELNVLVTQPLVEESKDKGLEKKETKSEKDKIGATLSDLAVRDICTSEKEWILLYAWWLTEKEGKNTFGWKDIKDKYSDSGRWTKSRGSNITTNIKGCVTKVWFTKLKEDTYALTEFGRKEALGITERSSKPGSVIKKRKTKSKMQKKEKGDK